MDSNKRKYIYLDSAASASDSKFYVPDDFANPSSTHDAGRDAFVVLEHSREVIGQAINAKRPSEIIFTSGATEANNVAIFGIARAAQKNSNNKSRSRVIVSAIEHDSVMMPAKELENEGFDVQICNVDKNGFIDLKQYKTLLNSNTVLVSIQSSNTEIGTIQNLKPLIDAAHEVGAYFHSDFVGSYCNIDTDVNDLDVDAISFAGHKIGTAKGIGALYLKSGVACKPIIYGSGQEKGVRSGTQNVAMAASMEKATSYKLKNMKNQNTIHNELRNYLIKEIDNIKNVRLTCNVKEKPQMFLPNIVHLVFMDKTSSSLILHYGKYGISVSGGAACMAGGKEASHVLSAINVSQNEIFGAIRVSFSKSTTMDDVKKFIDATNDICS